MITVSASRSRSATLLLVVSDDGVGQPPRLDPAHSPSMGLQIVSALATQLGGTLSWRRCPGTNVTLIVPASAADESECNSNLPGGACGAGFRGGGGPHPSSHSQTARLFLQ